MLYTATYTCYFLCFYVMIKVEMKHDELCVTIYNYTFKGI